MVNPQTQNLPKDLTPVIETSLQKWQEGGKIQRLWEKDPNLWSGTDEAHWLGWLSIVEDQKKNIPSFLDIANEVQRSGFSHALLLGMGGSSLGPEVLQATFGKQKGFPEFHVLDSTDPAQVVAFEKKVDLTHTIFIVSSKSGSTLEPNIFKSYFFKRVKDDVNPKHPGSCFIAITDPGSKLEKMAREEKFRHIFMGVPSIGGRYSALSHFGMIPAAIMGLDMINFLNHTQEMVLACSPSVPVRENPGVTLGIILGELASRGKDKVTIIASPGLRALGGWLEQLVAESTGKEGKAIIPVDLEKVMSPNFYGEDRVFVYLHLKGDPDEAQGRAVEALSNAGQPVIQIFVEEIYNLGQEFFRWEIATAVVGSILRINPFNQPDVEASKIETKKLTGEFEKNGFLPSEAPILKEGPLQLFADPKNEKALLKELGNEKTLFGFLKAHLNRLTPGDYFGVLAYIEMNSAHFDVLQEIRHAVRDKKQVATCLGFGPRFLHSTGQAYKGGPNSGVFLQITCENEKDVAIPGQKFSFGIVKNAQARGDFQVLADRGRRALRVHIGVDVKRDLITLRDLIKRILE
ncbi:MAG TPA: bifunctional transaldolase/phosoglucose isomerase [Nitrospiria bacterium]|jgi:glucose-6-phosphate isomerase